MKSLKLLGVLLVGLFMPILVNADTAVIKDVEALKACVETSNICEINANIEVKDIDFNKGHIRIAKDYKLIIAGATKVSSNATLEAIGNIHVLSGAVLDATEMSYGATGLIASQPGKLVMENGGTFKALDYWNQVWISQGKDGWTPKEGGHLFEGCTPGATVEIADRTYVLTNDGWKGAIQSGNEYYTRLVDAIEAAPKNQTTIKLLANINSAQGIFTGVANPKNIVFDLNGKTLSFRDGALVGSVNTKNQNIHIERGSTIVFKNGNMISSSDSLMFLQNYCDLTLDSVNIDTTNVATKNKYYSVSLNNGTINIVGSTSINSKSIAFDAYWWPAFGYTEGAVVTVNTTGKISGIIEVSANSDPEESKTILKIDKINHEGTIEVLDEALKDNISIYSGSFSTNVDAYATEGRKASLLNGKYVVAEAFDVLNHAGENGALTFDKDFAIAGEVVTLTITPDKEYEIESVKIIDKDNNVIEVKDNKFTMPESDVWVSVKFSPIQTTEAPVVDEDNTIGVSDADKTEDVLLDTIAKDDKYKDLSVAVEVVVEDIKASKDVEKEFTKALEEDKKENGKIVSYFDISVAVRNTVTDKVEGYLTELTDKIEFTVTLPKLDEVKEGFVRNYYVIKKHGDKVEVIDAKVSKDGKYITFATDEFSTYALAYEDVAKEAAGTATPSVPQTFDGITTTIIFASLALISMIGISLYFKKHLKNN